MRKLWITLGAILVLLLVAALVGPSFFNWNRYKDDIASAVSDATGRDLTIKGDLSFSVLPVPTLAAHDLRLANAPGAPGDRPMMTLESLNVRLAPRALLSGTIQASRVVLVKPSVRAEILADGTPNWRFRPDPAQSGGATAAGRVPGSGAGDGGASGGGMAVRLDSVVVRDGTLLYRDHRGGRKARVEAIDARITADSLKGPFRAEGSARFRDAALTFKGRAGDLASPPAAVRLGLTLPERNATAKVTGSLDKPLADPRLDGTLRLKAKRLKRALAPFVANVPGGLDRALSLKAPFVAGATRFRSERLDISLGDTQAEGSIEATWAETPDVAVDLDFNSLDLDRWLTGTGDAAEGSSAAPAGRAPPRPEAAEKPAEPRKKASAPDKQAPARGPVGRALAGLPAALDASLSVDINAIAWRQGVMRQARLNAALSGREITLKEATALLPGGADVSLYGALDARERVPRFSGTLEATANNLRSTLSWLGVNVGGVPASRLRRFALNADVNGTPRQVKVRNLKVQLDNARLNGGVVARLSGARPAFGISLYTPRLDLDAYRPRSSGEQSGSSGGRNKDASGGGSAPGGGNTAGGGTADTPPAGPAVLNAFDANARLRVDKLIHRGRTLKDVTADVLLQKGTLTIREAAVGDLAGAGASVDGKVTGFGRKLRVDGLHYSLRTSRPAALFRFAGITPPLPPERLGGLVVAGSASGPVDRLEIDTRVQLAGVTLMADGTVAPLKPLPAYDVALKASHASFRDFARLFAGDYDPRGTNLGGFALNARARGGNGRLAFDDLRLRLGPATLAGRAVLTLTGRRPHLEADLDAGEVAIDPFLPPRKSARRDGAGGAGGRVPGHAVPDTSRQTIRPAAAQRWSARPITLAPLHTLDADVTLSATAVSKGRYRLNKARLAATLADGTLTLDHLKGRLFGGRVRLSGSVDAAPDTPVMTADLRADGVKVRHAIFRNRRVDVTDGRLDMATRLRARGRSEAALVRSLHGGGRFRVADGVLRGFDLAAVRHAIDKGQGVGGLLNAVRTAGSGGTTAFRRLSGTCTARKGVVKSHDLRLDAKGGRGRGEVTADLPKWRLDARTALRLKDLAKAPPLIMHFEGPLDAPRRRFEAENFANHILKHELGSRIREALGGDRKGSGGKKDGGDAARKVLEQLLGQ